MDEMQEYVERSEGQRGEDPPVTGVASRRVEPGREEEFEEWVSGILGAVKGFAGYLGSDVLRPKSAEEGDYRILYRFDHTSNLERWEESEERRRWLDRAEPLVREQTVGSRFNIGPKRVKMIRTVGKTASHVTTAIL